MTVRDIAMAAAGVGGSTTDPYFENVSLLLTGDGTNGAQNNTFLDSSTNNFTITRNGNTTQGTFSPYGNLWSNYFSGGVRLELGGQSEFAFGTSDFTWEAWVNPDSITGANGMVIYDSRPASTSGAYLIVYTTPTQWAATNGTTTFSGGTVTVGKWTHVAFCKSSGTSRLFIDGVQIASSADSVNYLNGASRPYIGQNGAYPNDTGSKFFGYISNLRIVKGTALYTSNFTPSTTPLTAVSGTSLLTCQSNRFIDNSSNNFTITRNGDVKVQRFSPFNPTAAYDAATIGGSGYFDGTGDYLTTSGTGSFNASSGNWTIEAWMYCTSSAQYDTLISGAVSGTTRFYCAWLGTTFYLGDGSQNPITFVNKPVNQWFHFACVKNGSTYTAYINGASVGSSTTALGNYTLTSWKIGYYDATNGYMNGYISNLRITNTAVYTSAFTPPTAPVTAISGTSLLTNFTNAGIPDAAMMNNLETVGNAQVSTSVKKYGTGSLYFGGNGDNLNIPNTFNFNMSGDFTIEMWLYVPTGYYQTIQRLVSANSGPSGAAYFSLGNDTGGVGAGKLCATQNVSAANPSIASSTSFPVATWTHVALVRSGSTVQIYQGGVSVASITNTDVWQFNNGNNGIRISGTPWSGTENLQGYIDDLRITKGYARYTTNFTPPTAALPTY